MIHTIRNEELTYVRYAHLSPMTLKMLEGGLTEETKYLTTALSRSWTYFTQSMVTIPNRFEEQETYYLFVPDRDTRQGVFDKLVLHLKLVDYAYWYASMLTKSTIPRAEEYILKLKGKNK